MSRHRTHLAGWVKGKISFQSELDPLTHVRTVEIDDPAVLRSLVEMGLVHPDPVDPPPPAVQAAVAAEDPTPELPRTRPVDEVPKRGPGRPPTKTAVNGRR